MQGLDDFMHAFDMELLKLYKRARVSTCIITPYKIIQSR